MRTTTINVVVIREDATTITAQADTRERAAAEVLLWAADPFYTRGHEFTRIFMADGINAIEEFYLEDLVEAFAPKCAHCGIQGELDSRQLCRTCR